MWNLPAKRSCKKYRDLVAKVDFELGGIAWHCKEVYEQNKHLYDDYIPTRMLGASNDFTTSCLIPFIFSRRRTVYP